MLLDEDGEIYPPYLTRSAVNQRHLMALLKDDFLCTSFFYTLWKLWISVPS